MKTKKSNFRESARKNNQQFNLYMDRMVELSVSMFEWNNLPETIDQRFLEMHLFKEGKIVFFKDEELGELCLPFAFNGKFDVYGIPESVRAFAVNGYHTTLTTNGKDQNGVIIWNNYLHTNSVDMAQNFAEKLWDLDRSISVNARAQKTPVLLQGSEQQRLTLLNLYKEVDGNSPVIFGDKNLDLNGISAITTNAPFVADKLYQLKMAIWNEALTWLGISNINVQKKERLITDEVSRNSGGTIASRYSRLEARRQAVEKINSLFGTNIEVNYREDFQNTDKDIDFGTDTLDTNGWKEKDTHE